MLSREVQALERENEELKQTIKELSKRFEEEEKPKACKNCKFFIWHYIVNLGKYTRTDVGHCIHGCRCKSKRSNETCDFFELGADIEGR